MIGGLLFATVLRCWFVPVVFSLVHGNTPVPSLGRIPRTPRGRRGSSPADFPLRLMNELHTSPADRSTRSGPAPWMPPAPPAAPSVRLGRYAVAAVVLVGIAFAAGWFPGSINAGRRGNHAATRGPLRHGGVRHARKSSPRLLPRKSVRKWAALYAGRPDTSDDGPWISGPR